MQTKIRRPFLRRTARSKFVRSLILKIILIFLIAVIAIIAIAFFSFTSEINKRIISERQNQLDNINSTITKRMEEISSIAYHVSNDRAFFIESTTTESHNSYEMTQNLSKYLTGNDFIDYIMFYRLSEPNTVYASCGEQTFHDFYVTYLSFFECTETEYLSHITNSKTAGFLPVFQGKNNTSYITYVSALPKLSKNPQAFVIILIPTSEIDSILFTELQNCFGSVTIFDGDGKEMYQVSNLSEKISNSLMMQDDANFFSENGSKYVKLRSVSGVNGITYQTVLRRNDLISEATNRQLIFILLLLILMFIAIFITLLCIVRQYKPITNLALSVKEVSPFADGGLIDEQRLLTSTFADLKDDREQKQKFELAYHAAEEANKAKSRFLSNMSHDIRTPMNAIVGMTEIAFRHLDDPHYVKDCLENVRVSSQYLLDIINNILDMSRIESGKIRLSEEVVELSKLVTGVTTILNHSIEVKSQILSIDVTEIHDERVIGDGVRLSQIFMNIISNSVKFTQNGGKIGLLMRQEPAVLDGYGEYTFVFSDNGIGMSKEFLGKIFDTFTRENNTSIAKIEGTGLGMSIVKSFVEMMGGTIQCESELGRGTTFTIRLSLRLAENQYCVKHSTENTSILITGEDEKACRDEERLFRELGAKTFVASSVDETISELTKGKEEKRDYTFLLLHQSQEDKSGLLVLQKLQNYYDKEKTTVVLAAKDILAVEKSTAYNQGIQSFVIAPMFRSTACNILNHELERRDNKDEGQDYDFTGMKVLLVEDNEVNRKIAHTIMKETNASVMEAANGKEAVEFFKNHEAFYFDIILMDVQMPLMNGYEATAAIRSIDREDASVVPIYVMTANTFDEDVRQVKEAGMNGHLGKPYVPRELYRILEQNFRHKNG